LIQSEAGQLFVTRAAAVKPDFELTQANSRAIARICRVLDGIPLALELAAAHISALSPETLASRLDDSLRLLVGGSRTVVPSQVGAFGPVVPIELLSLGCLDQR
jgi:predicted ATPase